VIALGLIPRKIAKNSADLIRRKFSIDGNDAASRRGVPHPPIRNHTARFRKPVIHHLRCEMHKMALKFRRGTARPAALAFV
jgi:hypothetical protein